MATEGINETCEFIEDQEQGDWNAILGMTTGMATIVDGKLVDNVLVSPMAHKVRNFQLNKPFPSKNVLKAVKNDRHHLKLIPP